MTSMRCVLAQSQKMCGWYELNKRPKYVVTFTPVPRNLLGAGRSRQIFPRPPRLPDLRLRWERCRGQRGHVSRQVPRHLCGPASWVQHRSAIDSLTLPRPPAEPRRARGSDCEERGGGRGHGQYARGPRRHLQVRTRAGLPAFVSNASPFFSRHEVIQMHHSRRGRYEVDEDSRYFFSTFRGQYDWHLRVVEGPEALLGFTAPFSTVCSHPPRTSFRAHRDQLRQTHALCDACP
jgi:hypothetical protein